MKTIRAVKVGNSVALIIPKELREKMGIEPGNNYDGDVMQGQRKLVVVEPGDDITPTGSVSNEFLEILEGVNKKYGPALAKLANL
ncbi:MAG: AbrB/MazE/SpoVT family DNA-binding domain-containing protein [Patescibacteria group bacterium]